MTQPQQATDADIRAAAAATAPWILELQSALDSVGSKTPDETSRGAKKVLDALSHAEPPFVTLRRDKDPPFGNRFRAKPEPGTRAPPGRHPSHTAELRRDAFLRFAVARELWVMRVDSAAGPRYPTFGELVTMVVTAALDEGREPLLQPSGPGEPGPGYEPADYAHSPLATDFFDGKLWKVIRYLDATLGTDLMGSIPRAYDRSDERSIAAWGRIWGACVALVALDWLRAKSVRPGDEPPSAKRLAETLWGGIATRFYAIRAPLPSGDKALHVDLLVQPLLAQVLDYHPRRWADAARGATSQVHVRMHGINRETVGHETFLRGRNVCQLYLAVLAQALSTLNHTIGAPAPGREPADQDVPTTRLTPVQDRILARLAEAATGRVPAPAPQVRLSEEFPKLSMLLGPREALRMSFGSLWHGALDFRPSPPAIADYSVDREELGTLVLWPYVAEETLWLDFACVVDDGERIEILDLVLDDTASVENGMRQSLVLPGVAPSPERTEALRAALSDPTRMACGYEYVGLGIVVVMTLDLTTSQQEP